MLLKEYISSFIKNFWWNNVFWIIWTPNIELVEEINKTQKFIQNVHEVNCVYSAMWWYLANKKVHFVIVTSWVWVTNLLTWLKEAYLSNIPLFLISTNNNCKYYWLWNHHDSSTLYDWVDTVWLTKDSTCFSIHWIDSNSVVWLMDKAYHNCLKYKKPVHISISKNLFNEDIKDLWLNFLYNQSIKVIHSYDKSDILNEFLKKISFPIIITSDWVDLYNFSNFINNNNIIFFNSFSNIQFLNNSLCHFWNFEYIKNNYFTKVSNNIDLLIFLWNDLNKYFLDPYLNEIKGKKILHISESVVDKCNFLWNNYFFIESDPNVFFEIFDNLNINISYDINFIKKYKSIIHKNYNNIYDSNIFYNFLNSFNSTILNGSSIFIDVGSVLHYTWLFLNPINKVDIFYPSSFLNMWTSYKWIWYSFYNKKRTYIFIWDWSFYMNMWEILICKEYDLNVTFIILNNKWYSSPLYMKYLSSIDIESNFCRYNHGFDFNIFSSSLWINYYLINEKENISDVLNNVYISEWVNIMEIKTNFNDNMPM